MAKIKLQDVKKAADIYKEFSPLVEPLIMEHGPKLADQMAQKIKHAGGALNNVQNAVFCKIRKRKDDKEQKKAQEEARQHAVSSSLPPVTAEEFLKSFEANVSDSGHLKGGFMAIPGCYAILTMKSARDKDLSTFKDVYVGCSDDIGFDVYVQLRGLGNVDVYADFKYKQPMKVLVYPCDGSQIESRYTSLVQDLQSVSSYNKWEALEAASGDRQ